MCMPRIFGSKLIDGKVEEKKSKKTECKKNEYRKKQIIQTSVEFEDEITYKRN